MLELTLWTRYRSEPRPGNVTPLAPRPTADLDDLLVRTSRTFALSIPLLEGPTRRQVTLGYLLFRIADTFEDAWVWPKERRIEALRRFGELVRDPDPEAIRRAVDGWLDEPPSRHQGYLELLGETPAVLAAHQALEEAAREVLSEHVVRTCDGMAEIVGRTDERNNLRLRDVADLERYCYIVAGIVGEMLTELFLLGAPSVGGVADELRARAVAFGEALQLVNILRDADDDADEGRCYLPAGVPRAEVFAKARRDLEVAGEYVRLLQENGAPRGTVAFTALPARLAWATLERVEEVGPGGKLTRGEVAQIVTSLNAALDHGQPALA